MATVTEHAVTEPITVDAACQTTRPSIKEEVQEAASAWHLCVEENDFDTDTSPLTGWGGADPHNSPTSASSPSSEYFPHKTEKIA